MILPAATVMLSSPLFWAVIVGWIISVTLHEFAHGLVAYLGGDHTIRERGGLSLNPLQYAHPVMTFVLPVIFLLMGGVPLVGAATYIRRDLLRNRWWQSAVSLAGPLTNFILFLICVIPLHPRVHWIDPNAALDSWTPPQVFLGAMSVLELVAVFVNLLPVPPLDGFGVIEPFLPETWRQTLGNMQIRMGLMFLIFLVLSTRLAADRMFAGVEHVMGFLGCDADTMDFISQSYNIALFGSAQK